MSKQKATKAAAKTKAATTKAAQKPAAKVAVSKPTKRSAVAAAKRAAPKPGAERKPGAGRKKSKPATRKPQAAPVPPSLGRPKVTAEEKLFLLFKEDYHARQIFEFLRAETVRDLETWSPEEIVKQLSLPIKQSVDRIRRKLAEYHRSLRDDQEFALKHRPPEPTEEKPAP